MAQTVYIWFAVIWNFSKVQFVLHILTFLEISTSVRRIMLTMENIV